ncbi:MAG TPA: ABC-type transport auxiliary lipoprotein family protein [Steroidobacteraceae bacterium]|nr:ABC-type transport auxiliary lipoprotein family protein [Steroidobacteraceae bacterium]
MKARRAATARSFAAFGPLLATVLLGTGCASGAFDSDQPYLQVYVLSSVPAVPDAPALAADVSVVRPLVRPGLDTDRIAVLYPDRRLDYFARSRWGGTTDLVVQSLLVESLRNASGVRSVQGDSSAFSADHVLQTEITDFQAEYREGGGAPEAHVRYIVTLGRFADRRPLASFVAEARVPAASNTLGDVIAAFDEASRQAATSVVERLRATVSTPVAQDSVPSQ